MIKIPSDKQKQHEQIKRQIDDFLSKGKKIKQFGVCFKDTGGYTFSDDARGSYKIWQINNGKNA